MLARLATLLLVALFSAGAAVPSLGAVRCGATGRLMTEACCPEGERPADDGAAHLARRCCERVESIAIAPADLHGRGAPSLQPDLTLIGVVEAPTSPTLLKGVASLHAGDARGSPPGERLDRFTAILRV